MVIFCIKLCRLSYSYKSSWIVGKQTCDHKTMFRIIFRWKKKVLSSPNYLERLSNLCGDELIFPKPVVVASTNFRFPTLLQDIQHEIETFLPESFRVGNIDLGIEKFYIFAILSDYFV